MSTAKKILGNTAIQVAGRGIMAAASVFILRLITGFLTVEEYGMYLAVYDFLAFFGIAADLGLFTIGVREMSRGERDRNFIASNIFSMRLFLSLTMMSLAVITVFLIPSYAGTYVPGGVAIAAMAVFLSIMHGTVSSVLQVELKMQFSTIGLVVGKLIAVGWMAAIVFYFYAGDPSAEAFYQLMIAGVVGNLFAFLYTLYYALKEARIRLNFSREYWREIMTTAVPYGTALILNMIYFRIDSTMLFFLSGAKEVGFYGPAVKILEIISTIPVFFMNSALPKLTEAVRKSKESVQRLLQLSFDFLFMTAVPIVVGIYLLAYPVISLISDNPELLSNTKAGIFGSDMALQILVFAMFFAFMNSLFTYSLLATNKQNHLLWINGGAAMFNVASNYFVIPEFGFRGAAATSIATEAFILVMAYLVAREQLVFKLEWGRTFKTLLAAGVMGLVVWQLKEPSYYWFGLKNLSVLLVSGIGASVYALLLLIMGAVPKEFRVWKKG